jgi:membrane-bound lytic murein transglycosylase D
VRNAGLGLTLIACLVGALTNALVGAGAGDAVRPTAYASSTPSSAAPLPEDLVRAADPAVWIAPADPAVLPASFARRRDELLGSPLLHDPEFLAEVARWVRFWETAPSQWFPTYLTRMTWFAEMVDTTLAAHELPWSLRYLPVIESGYSPSAVSSAKAVGMWQFMAHTARDFDIEVSRLVDDRRDPFVSTAAAADFLVQLRDDFGSWFLALAAYNAGPARIRGIIERHAPDAEPSDALYWAIRDFLPKETADFVPNLFGAIIVASDPAAHGYAVPEPQPFDFDRVPVLGAITFETVARATGTSRGEIARLNPRYLRGVTPAGEVVDLRVPVGLGPSFRDYFTENAGDAAPGS